MRNIEIMRTLWKSDINVSAVSCSCQNMLDRGSSSGSRVLLMPLQKFVVA